MRRSAEACSSEFATSKSSPFSTRLKIVYMPECSLLAHLALWCLSAPICKPWAAPFPEQH